MATLPPAGSQRSARSQNTELPPPYVSGDHRAQRVVIHYEERNVFISHPRFVVSNQGLFLRFVLGFLSGFGCGFMLYYGYLETPEFLAFVSHCMSRAKSAMGTSTVSPQALVLLRYCLTETKRLTDNGPFVAFALSLLFLLLPRAQTLILSLFKLNPAACMLLGTSLVYSLYSQLESRTSFEVAVQLLRGAIDTLEELLPFIRQGLLDIEKALGASNFQNQIDLVFLLLLLSLPRPQLQVLSALRAMTGVILLGMGFICMIRTLQSQCL